MAKATKGTQLELTVERRPPANSRATRRLRQTGVVPGVVYGRSVEPTPVTVGRKDLVKILHSKAGEHALVLLKMPAAKSGKDGAWERPALVKAVQHDPLDGHVVHVDFHAVALTERIRIKIPIVLRGEPVGVKQENGVLEHFLRELEIECLPTEIPEHVEYDVAAMKIGDTIHVKDLAVPKGAKVLSDLEGPIASVQLPKVEKVEEAAEAAPTEPEVLREKKPEDGEAGEAGKAEGGKGEAAAKDKDAKAEKKGKE